MVEHDLADRPATPPASTLVRRGLLRRCPVCGHGHLFSRWFVMREICPGCGFRFERESGHWVGSLGLNTVISFGALLVTLVAGIVATAPDVAVGPLLVACAAVAVLTPLVIFPFTRTLWSALDLLMRPLEPGELTRPLEPGELMRPLEPGEVPDGGAGRAERRP